MKAIPIKPHIHPRNHPRPRKYSQGLDQHPYHIEEPMTDPALSPEIEAVLADIFKVPVEDVPAEVNKLIEQGVEIARAMLPDAIPETLIEDVKAAWHRCALDDAVPQGPSVTDLESLFRGYVSATFFERIFADIHDMTLDDVPRALERLTKSLNQRLWRNPFQLGRHNAEDCVGDALSKCARKLHLLEKRSPSGFRSWINQIVDNTARDLLRKRKTKDKYCRVNHYEEMDKLESCDAMNSNRSLIPPESQPIETFLACGKDAVGGVLDPVFGPDRVELWNVFCTSISEENVGNRSKMPTLCCPLPHTWKTKKVYLTLRRLLSFNYATFAQSRRPPDWSVPSVWSPQQIENINKVIHHKLKAIIEEEGLNEHPDLTGPTTTTVMKATLDLYNSNDAPRDIPGQVWRCLCPGEAVFPADGSREGEAPAEPGQPPGAGSYG